MFKEYKKLPKQYKDKINEALEILQINPLNELLNIRKIQNFLSQPFFVAEPFTGTPGKYVQLQETIEGFSRLLSGDCDELPEQAFLMVGTIEEAFEKAKTLK